MTPRAVVVLCPQERDRRAVRAAGLDRRYQVAYVGHDLDANGTVAPSRPASTDGRLARPRA